MSLNGYKLNLSTQTLTLSAAFAKAANNPNSGEYALVQTFRHDFPNLKIERRTHNSPSKYRNRNGKVSERNQFKGLTYERMERFMGALPNSQEYLDTYFTLREKAAKMCNSPYAAVRSWFEAQFPKYKTNPLFYLENSAEIIPFSDFVETPAKEEIAAEWSA